MRGSRNCALIGLLMCLYTARANLDVRTCTRDDGRDGFCVAYYQCVNGTIDRSGDGILTPKSGQCPDKDNVPHKCCVLEKIKTEQIVLQNTPKCGIKNRDGVGPRTTASGVGGPTLLGELPWSVALFSTDQEQDLQDANGYFCGGTLIHPSVVLSAVHCFNNRVPEEVRIRVGDWNIHEATELVLHQEIGVTKIIEHEDYKDGNKANNIALLILSQPAKLSQHIAPICLPEQDALPSSTSTCFASGWGRDINDIYPSTISKMKMQITERATCQEAHRKGIPNPIFGLHESFICASSVAGRCAADGGSPLVCSVPNASNTFVQYGILSWATGCNKGELPAIYASVAKFRQWIDRKIVEQGFNSTYYTYTS